MVKSVSFRVIGDPRLHCESCEQRVARVLTSLTGIQQVRADATTQCIEVLFDPATLAVSGIVDRLALLGYTTEMADPAPPSHH